MIKVVSDGSSTTLAAAIATGKEVGNSEGLMELLDFLIDEGWTIILLGNQLSEEDSVYGIGVGVLDILLFLVVTPDAPVLTAVPLSFVEAGTPVMVSFIFVDPGVIVYDISELSSRVVVPYETLCNPPLALSLVSARVVSTECSAALVTRTPLII